MRILLWEWYRVKGKPVSMPFFGFRIKARPSDGMGRLIWYFRDRADTLFSFMKNYLRPGMTFVDVGANIGSHTIYGSHLVGGHGKVVSFEADPSTFALLKANTNLNHLANVLLLNHCVSDKQGTVSFNIHPDSARNSLIRNGSSQVCLSASTLDGLLPAGLRIDLLKIDVEGAESLVLEGAKRIFENRPPRVVVVEATSCAAQIRDFLVSYGYRLYRYDHGRLAFCEIEQPIFDTYALRDCAHRELSHLGFFVTKKDQAGKDIAMPGRRAG